MQLVSTLSLAVALAATWRLFQKIQSNNTYEPTADTPNADTDR
jgi:hypothetical protein